MNTKMIKQNSSWGLKLIGVLSLLKELLILKALFTLAGDMLVFTKAVGISAYLKSVDFFFLFNKSKLYIGGTFC